MLRLGPTLGIDQTNLNNTKWLGINIATWDLGGQAGLRKDYFNNPMVFGNVSVLFYVLDIQDAERYTESLDYFKKFIEKFKAGSEKPKILFLFHKTDPEIQDDSKTQKSIADLTSKVKNICGSYAISFFQTSIFDQAAIADAFFNGVIKDTPKGVIIGNYLREFAKLTFSSAVVLLDENVLVVGSHSTDTRFVEICEAVSPWMVNAMERIKRYEIKMELISGDILFEKTASKDNYAKVFIQRFQSSQKMPFTLMTLTQNKNTAKLSETNLPQLAKQMSELISSMMNN